MAQVLTLQDIQGLGGTKEDLNLLEGVDSESADELEFDDTGEDAVSYQEIQDFIRSIGIESTTKPTKITSAKESGDKDKRKQQEQKEEETRKRKSRTAHEDKKDSDNSQEGKQLRSKVKHSNLPIPPSSATDASTDIEKQLLSLLPKEHKKLLVRLDTAEAWFEQSASKEPAFPVSVAVLNHLTQLGAELMNREVEVYEKVREKAKGPSEVRWLKTVLSSGTLRDKMAARTLLIQESPVHTLSLMDTMLSMASKKGKRESILTVDTLTELWVSDLLPEDRKLKSLKQRPLDLLITGGQNDRSRHSVLLLWYYEDQLKSKYAQFISILQGLSFDSVVHIREKMVGHIFDLLYQKPEQEQALLSQLVNKLGDPVRRVASKTILLLMKLLNHHVNMKLVVMRQIESLLHRPNISQRAQYYGVCCLNQFILSPDDNTLAVKLMCIYFTFFKICVQQGQLDGKMLGGLLTGVNRAFPFLKGDIPAFEDHLHSLFKVVHVGPLATGIQALVFLFQVMESRQAVSGRFYQALYAKMMDPALKHSTKQAMFLNILFKSLKSDPVTNRVKAFLKRTLQVCAYHAPPFVCGCLYLISEVLKLKPALWSFILQSESTDEEHFEDVLECNDDTSLSSPDSKGARRNHHVAVEEQGHTIAAMEKLAGSTGVQLRGAQQYLMSHRNPIYCGAEGTCLWELASLSCHYHPSVQVFAKKIAAGKYIEYDSDPLEDFTLVRFLDRFVCKNPKQKPSDHGGSLMQRASKLTADAKRDIPVNSTQFAALDESKVRDDELFMHRYFSQKATGESKRKKKQKEREEEGSMEGLELIHGEGDAKMDFAGELEMQMKAQKQTTRRKHKGDSGSEEDLESDEDFDYNAMDDEDLGEDAVGEPSEAEVERMLLEEFSDEGGLEPEEQEPARKKKRHLDFKSGFDTTSMFAAADEFAYILEDSGDGSKKGSVSAKQISWELLKSRSHNKHQRHKKSQVQAGGCWNKTRSSRTESGGSPGRSKQSKKRSRRNPKSKNR